MSGCEVSFAYPLHYSIKDYNAGHGQEQDELIIQQAAHRFPAP
jgi:hypothetical protein